VSSTPLRGVRRLFAVLAATLTAGALVAPAAHADGPDLVITAAVDAGPHLIAKEFPITLTLTNTTSRQLTDVKLWEEGLSGSPLTLQDWAGIGLSGPGVHLDPGTSRSFTLTAVVWNWRQGEPHIRFHGAWDQLADLTVPLVDPTTTKGTVSGVVYADRNDDHAYEAGEGLAGATVTLYGGTPTPYEAVSGADGRFGFADVPAQRYGISTRDLPDGWISGAVAPEYVDVGAGPVTEPRLRSVRPLSEKLHATGSFDRTTYEPGDTAQVSFTLTNAGDAPLHGIVVHCDRFGSDNHLLGWDTWSDLGHPTAVDLAAGETRTFTETGTVPPSAVKYGEFLVACDFGPDPDTGDGRPEVVLFAHVTAPPGTTGGVLYHDDNGNYTVDPGEAIAGTAVTLVDRVDGAATATAATDPAGHVSFGPVPAGSYDVRVADGWVATEPGGYSVAVGTCGYCGQEWSLSFRH
jgi:hypothetical protein